MTRRVKPFLHSEFISVFCGADTVCLLKGGAEIIEIFKAAKLGYFANMQVIVYHLTKQTEKAGTFLLVLFIAYVNIWGNSVSHIYYRHCLNVYFAGSGNSGVE